MYPFIFILYIFRYAKVNIFFRLCLTFAPYCSCGNMSCSWCVVAMQPSPFISANVVSSVMAFLQLGIAQKTYKIVLIVMCSFLECKVTILEKGRFFLAEKCPQVLQRKKNALTLHSQSGTRAALKGLKARHFESLLLKSYTWWGSSVG